MTIDDLIKILKEYKEKYGNIDVHVKCQDEGGLYYGDLNITDVYLDHEYENEEKKYLVIA